MTWLGEIALHVTLVAPEIRESFALRCPELLGSFFGAVHDLHAASATAICRLHRHRPPLGIPEFNNLRRVGDHLGGAGNAEHTDSLGGFAGRDLVAHHLDGFGIRTDEGDPAFGYGAREIGVFGEESVARMHSIGTAAFNDVKDCVGVEVGLSAGLSAQAVGLVGKAHVERIAIKIGVDRHSGDAEFAASTNDSNRDLTTVCYEYFGKHRVMISRMSHEVATSAGDPFAASSRVANATGLGPLRHVEVTGSTNSDLVAEARDGNLLGRRCW